MANPYFNATYYLANNPDVFAAGINTAEGAWAHYEQYGAAEALNGVASRSPAPWFDIAYYLAKYPDLNTAGLTAGQLFGHFTEYGLAEGRSPSLAAEAVDAESLAAYAAANEDLRTAFGIKEGEEPTQAQLVQLAQHFYQFGYKENRDGLPAEFGDDTPGQTFTLTTDVDTWTGTNGDDLIQGDDTTFTRFDNIDGAGGNDTMRLFLAAAPDATGASIKNVQTVNVTATAAVALSLAAFDGTTSVWSDESTATLTLDDASLSTTFGVRNTGQDLVINIADATAGDDIVKLAVDGATGEIEVATGAVEGVSVDVAGVNTLTDLSVTAGALETLTITGAGDLTITADLDSALENVDASAATGDIELNLGDAAADAEITIVTGSGDDTIDASSQTNAGTETTVVLGAGADTFIAGAGVYFVDGGAGDDTITLTGAAAGSEVIGGTGADTITLGAAAATLVYTAGNESTYAGIDTIIGFTSGTHSIDLSALELTGDVTAIKTVTAAGIVGGADYFDGFAVSAVTVGTTTYTLVDANNNGQFDIDADLVLLGVDTAVIGDFVFA